MPNIDPRPSSSTANAALYPGESIKWAAGYPVLTKFQEGGQDSTLVVFITGGGVLARIASGFPGGATTDFLSFWLAQEGLPMLTLSYPMDHDVFEDKYPEFDLRNWAEQSAEVIARCSRARGLRDEIVVLAWSMAGRLAEPLTSALRDRGIGVELFVAMAASPALPNLLPGLASLEAAPTGLARVKGDYLTWLLRCLHDQCEEAGRDIIPTDLFVAEFTGDFPIGLAASAMRYEDGVFVHRPQRDLEEAGAFSFRQYPMIAVMTHASPIDARHAIMDRAVWGLYITQYLSETYVFDRVRDTASLPAETWKRIVDLIRDAPERLTMTMPGNHMFFVGEPGASKAVEALQELRFRAASLKSEVEAAVR